MENHAPQRRSPDIATGDLRPLGKEERERRIRHILEKLAEAHTQGSILFVESPRRDSGER